MRIVVDIDLDAPTTGQMRHLHDLIAGLAEHAIVETIGADGQQLHMQPGDQFVTINEETPNGRLGEIV